MRCVNDITQQAGMCEDTTHQWWPQSASAATTQTPLRVSLYANAKTWLNQPLRPFTLDSSMQGHCARHCVSAQHGTDWRPLSRDPEQQLGRQPNAGSSKADTLPARLPLSCCLALALCCITELMRLLSASRVTLSIPRFLYSSSLHSSPSPLPYSPLSTPPLARSLPPLQHSQQHTRTHQRPEEVQESV